METEIITASVTLSEWINSQIHNNDFLIGGLATVAFGWLAYLSQFFLGYLRRFIRRFFTMALTVRNDTTEVFYAFNDLLEDIKVERLRRSYVVDGEWKEGVMRWIVGPGYDYELYFWKGTPVVVHRELTQNQMAAYSKVKESMDFIFFSRNKNKIKTFIEEAKKYEDVMDENKIKIYKNYSDTWEVLSKKEKRGLDTVVIDPVTKKKILDKVDWFKANQEWYVKRGLNYKMGMLFYGEPGCGKSSLAFALASHYGMDIKVLNMSSLSDNQIVPLFSNVGKDSILLIEDIDTFKVSQARQNDDEDEGPRRSMQPASMLSPSTLLNVLDGVMSPDNLIVIATTNYINRLDSALTREGRFDMKIEIDKLDRNGIMKLFDIHYGESKAIKDLIESYNPVTGAKALSHIMVNDNPKDAAKEIINGMSEMQV